MELKKEYIHGGMRIKHPSGVVVVHKKADLLRLKEHTQRSITFLQDQERMIDEDIAAVDIKTKEKQS